MTRRQRILYAEQRTIHTPLLIRINRRPFIRKSAMGGPWLYGVLVLRSFAPGILSRSIVPPLPHPLRPAACFTVNLLAKLRWRSHGRQWPSKLERQRNGTYMPAKAINKILALSLTVAQRWPRAWSIIFEGFLPERNSHFCSCITFTWPYIYRFLWHSNTTRATERRKENGSFV